MTAIKLTRETLEAHFVESREIEFRNENYGIMDWENGNYDVLKAADNENGYVQLNGESFDCHTKAIEFLIDYIMNVQNGDTETKKTKKKIIKKKDEEPKFEGPRTVRVFGREIYIEENQELKFEDIRQKLVSEYGFPHFKKENVYYDFDMSTGTLEVMIKMQVKG